VAVTTKLPVSTISVGSQSGSPCSSSTYTSINDPSRSYNYTGNLGACDDDYPFVTSSGVLGFVLKVLEALKYLHGQPIRIIVMQS